VRLPFLLITMWFIHTSKSVTLVVSPVGTECSSGCTTLVGYNREFAFHSPESQKVGLGSRRIKSIHRYKKSEWVGALTSSGENMVVCDVRFEQMVKEGICQIGVEFRTPSLKFWGIPLPVAHTKDTY
jgi:hypothetical protein